MDTIHLWGMQQGRFIYNKLCLSINFIIFGPTNQQLWVFEAFRRSLGRAGMDWSQ
jgi:hypothetical protein